MFAIDDVIKIERTLENKKMWPQNQMKETRRFTMMGCWHAHGSGLQRGLGYALPRETYQRRCYCRLPPSWRITLLYSDPLIRPTAAEHADPLPKPLIRVHRVAASDAEPPSILPHRFVSAV
jgi:hypothetical protein